jgi:hypothetical protein
MFFGRNSLANELTELRLLGLCMATMHRIFDCILRIRQLAPSFRHLVLVYIESAVTAMSSCQHTARRCLLFHEIFRSSFTLLAAYTKGGRRGLPKPATIVFPHMRNFASRNVITYHSERLNPRATHTQCCPRQPRPGFAEPSASLCHGSDCLIGTFGNPAGLLRLEIHRQDLRLLHGLRVLLPLLFPVVQ